MIVDCENCQTRFRLDEARIPATGAKVRCSRCKAAFVVQRPTASREEFIEEVVAEATNPGASSAPGTTEDLFDTSEAGKSLGDGSGDADSDSGEEASNDEKWEFDEPPQQRAAPTDSEPEAVDSQAPAERPEADELDALGSPDEWDFLTGAKAIAAEARFEAPTTEPPSPSLAPRAAEPNAHEPEQAESVDASLEVAATAAAAESRAPTPAWLQTARETAQSMIDSGMWLASIALCSVGIALALSPGPEAPSAGSRAATLPGSLGDQELEITRHVLESGVGGVVTVVRGQLPPSAATREPFRLRATWLDADGRPIPGASEIAGPRIAARKLRELSLERLRAEYESHALELTAGGAFEVVFGALPADAQGVALRHERVPIPAPLATQPEESDAAEDATASSRPTARPSSE